MTKVAILAKDRIEIRGAVADDIPEIARIWHVGWHDAHATILPRALARVRTFENFLDRRFGTIAGNRVAGHRGMPLGFYMLWNDEVDQFYVSAQIRGTGMAAALLTDAEARLTSSAMPIARLSCAIGNKRAARFYEKHGWRCARTVVVRLDTIDGLFDINVWRYEKLLTPLTVARPSEDSAWSDGSDRCVPDRSHRVSARRSQTGSH